jgi:hypothetical protein
MDDMIELENEVAAGCQCDECINVFVSYKSWQN